jgi:hypothetical protein
MITGFVHLSGAYFNRASFLTIHFQRSTHPQIAIYVETFQFARELMEIEPVSMDSSAGR